MLKNQDIVCFGFADWDNPYKTNQHHLMERFSQYNRILFIESLGLRRPTFQKKDLLRIIKRIIKWFKGIKRINNNLYILSPMVIPFHRYSFIRKINTKLLKFQIIYAINKLQINSPILWSYIPNAVNYIETIKPKIVIYHCVDELTANPLIPKIPIKILEEELIKKSDIIFTSAKTLYEKSKKLNPSTYYMPNVADFNHFNKASNEELNINTEIQKISKPRIGFIGALSDYKIDFDLIAYIAKKHPDWSIILIGPTGEGEKAVNLNLILPYPNVYMLGPKPYSELPNILKGFDVCILPNKINDYTKNMFPMKFFEYLACGKPVVSTRLETLLDFKDYCYISLNYEDFEKNISVAINEDSKELILKRIEISKKYTWDLRLLEMSRIIKDTISNKNG